MYIQTANTTHIFIKCLHESITFEPSSATIYCLKYAKIQTLSNLYFPVCRQNGIHTFPYLENMYTILSFCLYTGKYGTGKVHISAYFTVINKQKQEIVMKTLILMNLTPPSIIDNTLIRMKPRLELD